VGMIPPPFNETDRLLAGMSREYYEPVAHRTPERA